MNRSRLVLALFLVGLILPIGAFAKGSSPHVFLTWMKEKTSDNITIVYRTQKAPEANAVLYDTVSHQGDIRLYRYNHQSLTPFVKEGIGHVNRTELTGLKPNTVYYFVVPTEDGGYSKEMSFRTIPEQGPIRFVTGGDMGDSGFGDVNQHVAKLNPHFAVIGGDVAYANGKISNWPKWARWLKEWHETMKTKDGHIIPFISAIGNHETNYINIKPIDRAPYYLGLFGQNKKTYFLRRFSDRIAFILLDTGHIAFHGGRQKAWLKKTLEANKNVPVRFAVYHIPLYPSHRSPSNPISVAGRLFWLSLFDKYELTTAFENHDHTMKRTKPLRDNKVAANINEGTLYLGDGCWGKSGRDVREEWYLEKAISSQHAWFVEVGKKEIQYKAIDHRGQIIDQVKKLIN